MRFAHIDPDAFLVDTFRLGKAVYHSGFRPKHAISIWRGGTPVGLGVDAYFRSRGLSISHTTIATGSYTGIGTQGEVIVKNLEHLVQVVCPEDGLLIIDDVYESGKTVKRVVELLREMARANTPEDIRVATVHHKPALATFAALPLITLEAIDADVWIDYPHELADMVTTEGGDERIREKDAELWQVLHGAVTEPTQIPDGGQPYIYLTARELLLDSVRLAVNICHDSWKPDFIIALWPGGVLAGLPIHEVYKYLLKRSGSTHRAPDHISINTQPTRFSYRNLIVGLHYLADTINRTDNILVIDTTFRAGRLVNDVVMRLKEELRRNLDHERIRVASVYYNREDRSTWTVRPDVLRPHYYLKSTTREVVYPHSVHKLPDPRRVLRSKNPALWQVLYGD